MGFFDKIFGWQQTTGQDTYERSGHKMRYTPAGGWEPPHPPAANNLHGDARFADIAYDRHAMQPALSSGKQTDLWFGTGVNFLSNTPGEDIGYGHDRHVLTVAPTGSGKGAAALIPNLIMGYKRSMIVIDPKGQNAAVTARARRAGGRAAAFLNPFNEHGLGTMHYNPLRALSIDSPNLAADVGSIAEALIISEGKDPHWSDSARDLVACLILHLVATEGDEASLPRMRSLLTQPKPLFRDTIADMARSEHSFIAQPAGRFLYDNDEIASIISTAINQTRFLDDPAITRVLSTAENPDENVHPLSFKQASATLFIILPARYLAPYARFFRLIVVSLLDQMTSRPGGDVPVTFMLDEFAQLGHLSSIETAFALARGYGVQLWPFVQDLNQLKDIYKDRWETFIANAGAVQWFTPNDTMTAEYLSKRIGNMTVEMKETSQGQSYNQNTGPTQNSLSNTWNASEKLHSVPFMSVQDLYGFPSHLQIITLAGLKYPICARREPYFEWSRNPAFASWMALVDPDPFHAGRDQKIAAQQTLVSTSIPTLKSKPSGDGIPKVQLSKLSFSKIPITLRWLFRKKEIYGSDSLIRNNITLAMESDAGMALMRIIERRSSDWPILDIYVMGLGIGFVFQIGSVPMAICTKSLYATHAEFKGFVVYKSKELAPAMRKACDGTGRGGGPFTIVAAFDNKPSLPIIGTVWDEPPLNEIVVVLNDWVAGKLTDRKYINFSAVFGRTEEKAETVSDFPNLERPPH